MWLWLERPVSAAMAASGRRLSKTSSWARASRKRLTWACGVRPFVPLSSRTNWAEPDNLIMPQGTSLYFERMRAATTSADVFSRLYMVPGMGHSSGGTGVNQFGQGSSGAVPMTPQRDISRALMDWSEKGHAPTSLATFSAVMSGRAICQAKVTWAGVALHSAATASSVASSS